MRSKTKYSQAFQDHRHFFLPSRLRMISANKTSISNDTELLQSQKWFIMFWMLVVR